ncbi:reverse transcriptase family protein [Paludisphaera soli]|uniref:reverse transcriptase family protein n=1 Tax=Paludisphaera soli TaxID=2712865 RepID=UPI001981BDC8|nr:reverse transcriptase family protein [Paludisphaera soli]
MAAPPPTPEASTDPYFSARTDPTKEASPKKVDPLDAGDYLPITREEIKEEAKGKNLFNSFAFGLRSVIPPADDLRTKLIDRALVTHGLLSPEQLREIHDVGARMEAMKPTMAAVEHRAARAGEAAVAADREARARLKAQMKAESAERKRIRDEAISQRKATDILFLGRGVSSRLGDRTGDASKLAEAGLPVVSTPAELAAALGISVPKLRWLAFHNEAATRVHYVQFTVPKKSGGTRTLSAPHRSLAEAQGWILREVLAKLPVEPTAHGFVTGRSILTNASPHCRKRLVVNMDLEGFFPSIGFRRVRSVFGRLGYSPAVATILALLCTECPRRSVVYAGETYHVATGPRGLPQGACTSPALSNQVTRRLDRRLGGLASRLGLTYSRYADDLTFSGDEVLEGRVGYLMARVRHLAGDEGFAVNEAKSRVLRRGTAQTVTGLVVNDRPGVRRTEVRRLRAILHRARSEGLAAQNREGHPDFLAWLRGKIAFVAMARPDVGAALRAELESLLVR